MPTTMPKIQAKMQSLRLHPKKSANPRWNICTEADELIVENKGDKVVVIMTPESFEEETTADGNEVEDEVPVAGGDFEDFE